MSFFLSIRFRNAKLIPNTNDITHCFSAKSNSKISHKSVTTQLNNYGYLLGLCFFNKLFLKYSTVNQSITYYSTNYSEGWTMTNLSAKLFLSKIIIFWLESSDRLIEVSAT